MGDPTADGMVFASLMASLRSRLEDYQVSRQLLGSAESWEQGGRADGLLAQDVRGWKQQRAMLVAARAQALVAVPEFVGTYVEAGRKLARKRQRRAIFRRLFISAQVVTAAAGVIIAIPAIHERARANQASGALSTVVSLRQDLPEWAGLLSGGILLGQPGPEQRQVARQTLWNTLAQPWTLGSVPDGPDVAVDDVVPSDDGRTGVVLWYDGVRTASYGVYDLRRSRVLFRHALPGRFGFLTGSSDGNRILAYGLDGIVEIDVQRQRVRSLLRGRSVGAAAYNPAGTSVVALPNNGAPQVVSLQDSAVARSLPYAVTGFLALGTARTHTYVVDTQAGRARVRDAFTGALALSGSSQVRAPESASVQPDVDGVALLSSDGIVHEVSARSGEPISVGAALTKVVALGHGHLAFFGPFARSFVTDAHGLELGPVCTTLPRVADIKASTKGHTVFCRGVVLNEMFSTPPGPLMLTGIVWRTRPEPLPPLTIAVQGPDLLLTSGSHHLRVHTGDADISAVAMSPAPRRLLVGTRAGEAVIVSLDSTEVPIVVRWSAPDRSAVVAADFSGTPMLKTAAGNAWAVPDCPACGADLGLLVRLKQKLAESTCWSPRQLSFTSETARRVFELRVCDPHAKLPRVS
jgi:hypothetical protein